MQGWDVAASSNIISVCINSLEQNRQMPGRADKIFMFFRYEEIEDLLAGGE